MRVNQTFNRKKLLFVLDFHKKKFVVNFALTDSLAGYYNKRGRIVKNVHYFKIDMT